MTIHQPIWPSSPAQSDIVLAFENKVIPHVRHLEAKKAIRKLHSRFRPRDASEKFKARGLIIVGATGAGKTTALQDYMADFPDLTLESVADGSADASGVPAARIEALRDGDLRRVVFVQAPKKTTQRGLVAAILGAYKYKVRDHWNTTEIIERIDYLAGELGTELIFIDEGHHMVSQTNDELTNDNAEFIKSLLNEVKVQIVIAGLPRLQRLYDEKQLARRLEPMVRLRPYNWSTKEGRVAFCGLMGAFEKMLKLPEPSGLHRQEIAKRIYVATGGEVGIVSKHLSEALSIALETGRSSLSLDLLGQVHASFHRGHGDDEEEEIEFDAILDDEDLVEPGAMKPSDNPFLCSDERLKAIWHERRVAEQEVQKPTRSKSSEDGTRQTTLRASGRAPFTPFKRS